ncbi:MAG TPA: ComEC/Rec2 family competence protein, partial [Candidatus Gracilibacteria bacterium]
HLPLDQSVAYGDELKVTGKLSDPPRLEGFNYRKYLERFGVQKIMKAPKSIEILCRGCEGNWVTRRASGLRNWMGSNLKASLPSPHRELAMGILLGVKKELPPSVKQSFQDSGLQHILVVSGSNIAIVMLCFQMVFRRFGPYINALFSILGIVFFVLMAGGDAPVIRAALMGSLAGIGVAGGQKIDVINALLLSSCLMGLAIPSMIQSDLGFWLSFGATMGIIVFTPIFALLLQTIQIPNSKYQITKSTSSSVPEFLNSHVWLSAILKILSMSLGAQLAVLPLLLLFFGSFPLGGVFANIFIEPLMPMLMLGSSILGLCGSLSSGLVWPFRAVVYFGFEILLSLSQWFSHFPALEIPQKLSFLSLIALLVLGLLLVLHPKLSEIHLAKPAK